MTGASWILRLRLPAPAVPAFDRALMPFGAVTSFAESEDDAGFWQVDLHCPALPDAGLLAETLASAARAAGVETPDPRLAAVPPRDWVSESRAGIQPILAGRFFIHESDYAGPVPPGRIRLRVDAGLAFGTGAHATTEGCLLALDRLGRERRFRRPLDLGCGSGVLGLAMARMWGVTVTASDIDPIAVAVARTNAARNGVGRAGPGPALRAVRGAGFGVASVRAGAPYDVIVANILARPLRDMATDLSAALAPGGRAVLSGFLVRDEAALIAAYRPRGLALVRRLRRRGWSVLTFRRPGGRR